MKALSSGDELRDDDDEGLRKDVVDVSRNLEGTLDCELFEGEKWD